MDLCTEFHRLLIVIRIFYSNSIMKPLAKIDEGGAREREERKFEFKINKTFTFHQWT